MKRTLGFFVIACVVIAAGYFKSRRVNAHCIFSGREINQPDRLNVSSVVTGIKNPVSVAFAPGEPLPFALGKGGQLYRAPSDNPVHNFSSKIEKVGFDLGGMSVVFHPDFQANHRFFFMYHPVPQDIRIAEYRMNPKTFEVDPAFERIILEIKRDAQGHSGGQMLFGADRYLYIATGDGTLGSDEENNGQNLKNLEGKVLRIDVNSDDAASSYRIPPDNPDFGPGTRREIYAFGFRNPWRFGIDSANGNLWVGDVGDKSFEEISLVQKGGNYGWRLMEGNLCKFDPECRRKDLIPPVFAYSHAEGNSVIGGVLYRGKAIPWLRGHFVYADYGTLKIYALELTEKFEFVRRIELLDIGNVVAGFAQDSDGEIFFAELSSEGAVRKLIPADTKQDNRPFPTTLSETGCFTDLKTMTPIGRGMAYNVLNPYWSNGAKMSHFIFVPVGEKIEIRNDREWEFPNETVFAQHLTYQVTDGQASKPVETRFLVKRDAQLLGYSYKWHADGTDATLLTEAESMPLKILEDGKTVDVTHLFPSRGECSMCHNKTLHYGILSANNSQFDPGENLASANALQLAHLADLHKRYDGASARADFIPLVDFRDKTASIERRARSYIHANCGHCHNRYSFTGENRMDLRIGATYEQTEACDMPVINALFPPPMKLIAPGHPERSAIYLRIKSAEPGVRMPPLQRTRTDDEGAEVVWNWIKSIKSCKN